MLLMLDTANLDQIKEVMEFGFLDGVTTNPAILSKELGGSDLSFRSDAKALFSHLEKMRDLLTTSRSLHVQVTAPDCATMVEEGRLLEKFLGSYNTYIKVPATVEGVKAIRILHEEGIKVTGTAVNSIMQGLLAYHAGAEYVATYYSNMVAKGIDADFVTRTLCEVFKRDHSETKLLSASFKSPDDVARCYALGSEACTVSYDVLMASLNCPASMGHLEKFEKSWSSVFGKDYTELAKEL